MKNFSKAIVGLVATSLLLSVGSTADESSHYGAISTLKNYAASAGPNLSESWSWIQVAGLTATSDCVSGNEGVGNLAYLAIPGSEKYMESIALSAYHSSDLVTVEIDTTALYKGYCQIQSIAYLPEPPDGTPTILFNSLDSNNKGTELVLSNNNGTVSMDASVDAWRTVTGVAPLNPGQKYYWEMTIDERSSGKIMPGIVSVADLNSHIGASTAQEGYGWHSKLAGVTFHAGTSIEPFILFEKGDRLMFAYDPDAGKVWFGNNGVWQGDPATGAGARYSSVTGVQYPAITILRDGVANVIFDTADFQYAPPAGFVPSTVSQ